MNITIEQINAMNRNTVMEVLGIEYTALGDGFIHGKMPVDARHHQPMGILHGGVTAVLAETLGSVGSHLIAQTEGKAAVGLEISVNHLKSMSSGTLFGYAKIIHQGKRTHLWQIDLKNESDQMIAIAKLSVMIIDKKG
jgi:1,4-dihydroxy-2-naphthoyl-CoA hydrolase